MLTACKYIIKLGGFNLTPLAKEFRLESYFLLKS